MNDITKQAAYLDLKCSEHTWPPCGRLGRDTTGVAMCASQSLERTLTDSCVFTNFGIAKTLERHGQCHLLDVFGYTTDHGYKGDDRWPVGTKGGATRESTNAELTQEAG
jgi:hypothetical protein